MTDTPTHADRFPMPDLAPSQVAAMREHWVGLGLDAARFDDAATSSSESVTTVPPASGPAVADGAVMAMVAGLREARVSEADIAAALAADGYTLPPSDDRTEEQIAHDAAWGGATPDAYQIDYVGRFPGVDVGGIAAFDGEARAWLSEIGFPAGTGPSVIEAALDARARLSQMPEAARQLWALEQKALFEQVSGGPEKAAERLALAKTALARGRANFTDALNGNGALHDATLVSLLALQGERMAARP